MNSNNTYIIAIKKEIRVYSQATFQIIDTIQVPFKENVHVKREGEQSQEALIQKMQIIYVQQSKNEHRIAVLVGCNIYQDECQNYQLFIYER